MKATISLAGKDREVDFSQPLDISIPLSENGPVAWYAAPATIRAVITRQFTGSVALGGSVNFRDVRMNPHAHGTHTESIGHITRELNSVNQLIRTYFHHAQLITITPEIVQVENQLSKKGDRIISEKQIAPLLGDYASALIIRTLPNNDSKKSANYSFSNFPYFTPEAMNLLVKKNIRHLLTDLPSVDREEDGGKLLAHRSFWSFPGNSRTDCSITEFIFVNEDIEDGEYLLNLQFAPFENDASPSRPVLFRLK